MDGWQGGWHPFLESAYRGGGVAVGAGYQRFVSAYNFVDARQLHGNRLSGRGRVRRAAVVRSTRTLVAARRLGEATQVGYFGVGTTSVDDRTNYAFQRPTRRRSSP
jgi:hypothetical protein